MRIYDRFSSRDMVEGINKIGSSQFVSIEDYSKRYGFIEGAQVGILFERIGVLLEQDLIDVYLVDRLFGPMLNILWTKMKPEIYSMRKSLDEPFFFSHFEHLIDRLSTYREQN